MTSCIIRLTQGHVAVIDAEDYAALSAFRWHVVKTVHGMYAAAKINGKSVYMHRFLLKPMFGLQCDHVNGNGLDNRRCNLRFANNQQNSWNRGRRKNNKTGHIGVSWDTQRKKYHASIKFNGKSISLGRFPTKEAAVEAYERKAKEVFGLFKREVRL